MRAREFTTESMIKIGAPSQRAQAWINKVYQLYPGTFQNNHVMMWGEGDDQQFAMFELVPSMSKRDAVEVKWFQAYPLRSGVGSRAMAELQRLAREDGIALTLYPWDRGQVSQTKLMKFYRGHGFKPTARGSKNMVWEPELDEMAGSIHGGVRQVLQNKGYQYLGSGIDKQAWLEPGTGQVLIVFGYRKDYDEFSPDQRMFVDWINYCNQNQDNPHLPRFSGFESFQFRGKNYIQARMEALQKLPQDVRTFISYLANYVERSGDTNVKNILVDLIDSEGFDKDLEHYINQLGGIDSAAGLIKTIQQVMSFGMQHGFNIDLHGDNYMQRANGTIVVNDPFVLWLRSE